MRMRKVLSFVLVLSLVLGSFSMAFAADSAAGLSDIDGSANKEAIQVAYDLDIVTGNPDGTYLPEKAVNRAEFAALITRALAIPDSALAGYTTTSFKDTTGYGWAVPYLAFCQSKGIMIGDGNGNAMPGRTISVNEAMTMALRAIGYTNNSSMLVGTWPANYVSLAQNNDLYDDVAKDITVNKSSAAQIIYNTLTVQKVAVNTDGTTDFLWVDGVVNGTALNLLNSNLGCEAFEGVILGADYDYDDAIINITGDLGAYGTAYLNGDDELVAFTKDSVALTGKVDGTKFKVGDTKYDFSTNTFTTQGATFANSNVASNLNITSGAIAAFALANADDTETVTINVDLSGKKIKDIYSAVAWNATITDLADSNVQEDIEDGELLTEDFVLDDNDEIDLASFQLVGVASLDKIDKDNVVYVYSDSNNEIRKVAVGTETVEGLVEETDVVNDTVRIDGKVYDLAPSSLAKVSIPADIDVDSEGIFYLDANGEIYDFDGTGKADTYGVVKIFQAKFGVDNAKYQLYTSDDSTKTVVFAEDNDDDMDWTSTAAARIAAVKTTGALIGYSLDSNGNIDTIDNTFTTETAVDFQSSKVLYIGATPYDIDSDAVVFTYKGTTATTKDYDVASLSEIEKGSIASLASPASIILNSNGDVAAMFIDESFVDVEDDDVYGVFNARTSAKAGDDNVYKFVGYIDGTEFTNYTDNRSGFPLAGIFDVYQITVDANDVITAAVGLTGKSYIPKTSSGEVDANVIITDVSSDRTVITVTGGDKYTIANNAAVYKYDADDKEFSVSKLTALRKGYTVSLFDTKGDDANGIATVVIYIED